MKSEDEQEGNQTFEDGSKRLLVYTHQVREFTGNPRKYFDPLELAELRNSIDTVGQVHDLICIEVSDPDDPKIKYEAIGGNRRLRAIKQSRKKQIWIVVKPLPADNKRVLQLHALVDNLGRADMTLYDTADALELQLRLGTSANDLVDITGKPLPWVKGMIKISRKLHPDLKLKLDKPTPKDDQIGKVEALALCRLDHKQQLDAYEESKRHFNLSSTRRAQLLNAAASLAKTGESGVNGNQPHQIISNLGPDRLMERDAASRSGSARRKGSNQKIIMRVLNTWFGDAFRILDMSAVDFQKALSTRSPEDLNIWMERLRKIESAANRLKVEVGKHRNSA